MSGRWKLTGLTIAAFLALLTFYWLSYAYAREWNQHFLRGEDKLIEWLTFGGFISAAVILLRAAPGRPRLAALYLAGLGFFFFVCAGEEISWGQRILGFSTPHEVKQVNEQHEFNLHNLNLQHIHPLAIVSLFMKIFGIAAPVIAWNRWSRYVPSLSVAPAFIFAEALSSTVGACKPWLVEKFGQDVAMVVRLDTAEFKEMVWGLSCLLAALALRAAWKNP